MPKRFDLRSIQSESLDLPSVASYLDWRPSLREFQRESQEFPSLKNLQSLDEDEFPSLRSFQSLDDLDDSSETKQMDENLGWRKGKVSPDSHQVSGIEKRLESISLTKRKISLSESSLLNIINSQAKDNMGILDKGSENYTPVKLADKKSDIKDILDKGEDHPVQNLMVNNFTDIGPQRKLKSKIALRERFQDFK